MRPDIRWGNGRGPWHGPGEQEPTKTDTSPTNTTKPTTPCPPTTKPTEPSEPPEPTWTEPAVPGIRWRWRRRCRAVAALQAAVGARYAAARRTTACPARSARRGRRARGGRRRCGCRGARRCRGADRVAGDRGAAPWPRDRRWRRRSRSANRPGAGCEGHIRAAASRTRLTARECGLQRRRTERVVSDRLHRVSANRRIAAGRGPCGAWTCRELWCSRVPGD